MTRRAFATLLALALAVIPLAGCGDPRSDQPTPNDIARDQQLAESCPKGQQLATYLGVDLSESGRDDEIVRSRETAIQDIVHRTAVCSGHLRVVAFSASVAATVVVFDGDLTTPGATQIAQLRKVPGLVATTVPKVLVGLTQADGRLNPHGSDITSQFETAREYADQLNGGTDRYVLDVELLTDGVQTVGTTLASSDLTISTAIDLASQGPAPMLPSGTAVELSGIGKEAGPLPSTAYVDALKAFYLTYCHRAGATCQAVTDYTPGS